MTIYKEFQDAICAAARQYSQNPNDPVNVKKAEELLLTAQQSAKKSGLKDTHVDVLYDGVIDDLSPLTPAGLLAAEGDYIACAWLFKHEACVDLAIRGAVVGNQMNCVELIIDNHNIEYSSAISKSNLLLRLFDKEDPVKDRVFIKLIIKKYKEEGRLIASNLTAFLVRDKKWLELSWLMEEGIILPQTVYEKHKLSSKQLAEIQIDPLIVELLKGYPSNEATKMTREINKIKRHDIEKPVVKKTGFPGKFFAKKTVLKEIELPLLSDSTKVVNYWSDSQE